MIDWIAIRTACSKAEQAENALKWLREFAPTGPVNQDTLHFGAMLNRASACPGSKEAAEYLKAACQQMAGEIADRAARLANEDIAKAKELVAIEGTGDVAQRRFGRNHARVCNNPQVLTCARTECQQANRCMGVVK